jgi:hypothetical protein
VWASDPILSAAFPQGDSYDATGRPIVVEVDYSFDAVNVVVGQCYGDDDRPGEAALSVNQARQLRDALDRAIRNADRLGHRLR